MAKASAGAVEHLPVAQVRNLADFLGEAKEAGCWIYGAAAGARSPYDEPDYTRRRRARAGRGGPRACARGWRGPATTLVSLPLRGRIESLNVSAAAAVLLYEILQREKLDSAP